MQITSMKTLGQVIKQQRRRIPLSQQELADLATVSRTSIQRIEGGVESTEFGTVLKVLNILNLSLDLKGDLPQIQRDKWPEKGE
ncbi:MAG TPA: helix-turn-helix domain-containing protein [Candidatus Nitrosotenuis sp.]|jgi:predicted transcriptional regulator|nr:helix-turn-helix domain-containing protein [Candidatus Nitrosotenuis sp.]